ncbi:hypothetical protein APK15_23 [Acinetobacter phage APK15]|uniref:Uncharacterized protein n=1 Tax=Acinetobacter phage APK15 TaxID=2873374 RepID=A0AAE8XKR6_9CAUD|nr:hypothetical protein APK15_23 [Acinetobacter phage APK15]
MVECIRDMATSSIVWMCYLRFNQVVLST